MKKSSAWAVLCLTTSMAAFQGCGNESKSQKRVATEGAGIIEVDLSQTASKDVSEEIKAFGLSGCSIDKLTVKSFTTHDGGWTIVEGDDAMQFFATGSGSNAACKAACLDSARKMKEDHPRYKFATVFYGKSQHRLHHHKCNILGQDPAWADYGTFVTEDHIH